MNGKLKGTIIGASALFVGIGVGASTQPVPDTITKTQTVVKHVPGPVKWKTHTVNHTIVHTKRVRYTPAACAEAIHHAEDIGRRSSDFAKIAVKYLPLITRAYKAGVNDGVTMDTSGNSILPIVSTMRENNDKLDALNARVTKTVSQFNDAKKICLNN